MHSAPLTSGAPTEAELDAAIDLVAGQLDAAFLRSGQALASAYDLVERLIAKLAGLTDALDRDGGRRAISDLEATAARIAGIPQAISARSTALAALGNINRLIRAQVFTFDRTLDFLRVCALNIKIAAAGRDGFSEFGDLMMSRLDVSGHEIRAVRSEMEQLLSIIPAVSAVDRVLAEQAESITADIPAELADNARGLRRYLDAATDRSDKVAAIARAIRSRLGEALGAMQIGDIARQRLEHVAQGLRLIDAECGPQSFDPATRSADAGHVLALLEAQMASTTAEFLQESERLATSQQLLGPDLAELLALRKGRDDEGSSADFLQRLEHKVDSVRELTGGLREVDRRSLELAAETAGMVERLGTRLAIVHRITAEVDNMAWNAEIRCGNMGEHGRGIAPVAAEIRKLVGQLKQTSAEVRSAVETLNGAAQGMTAGAPGASAGGDTLEQILATIREGTRHMEVSLVGIDGEAAAVGSVLAQSMESIAEIGSIANPMQAALDRFAALAPTALSEFDAPTEAATELLTELAKIYTMASEREIHGRFSRSETVVSADPIGLKAQDPADEDDGLF